MRSPAQNAICNRTMWLGTNEHFAWASSVGGGGFF